MFEGKKLFQLADIENLIKTRRSLLISSISTLIFANLIIVSDNISVFGVEIVISQKNIVLLGQAGTLYLLTVFFLQAFPEFIKMYGWIWDSRINSLERRAWNRFRDEWDMHDNGYEDDSYGPAADSKTIEWRFSQIRKKKTSQMEIFSVVATLIANFFVAYLSPIIAASLCLFWPKALGLLLN